MPVYQIHDVSFNETYDCPDDVLILDRAEEIGLDYPLVPNRRRCQFNVFGVKD